MTCKAVKIDELKNRTHGVWYKKWELRDGDRCFGEMVNNIYSSDCTQFTVYFFSALGKDFGVTGFKAFASRDEALAYARDNKDCNVSYTLAMVDHHLALLKDSRYQEEMSDDFFYTNGKGDRYDRKERELLRMREQFAEAGVPG
jgi:hypothetical protein